MSIAFTRYAITPVAKPRMTQRDKWQRRPAVLRYRAFADEVRRTVTLPALSEAWHIVFVLPMPASWSAKQKRDTNLTPHRGHIDLDNTLKAFLDALFPRGDQHIADVRASKLWGVRGEIWIRALEDWR